MVDCIVLFVVIRYSIEMAKRYKNYCPLNRKFFRLNKQLSIYDRIEMSSFELNKTVGEENVLVRLGTKSQLVGTRNYVSYLYSKSKHRIGSIFRRFKLKVL